MKSVAFLRNTWRKWEQRSSDTRDDASATRQSESLKRKQPVRPSTAPELTIGINHLPLNNDTTTTVDESWQSTRNFPAVSPVYGSITHNRSERTLVDRNSSRLRLYVANQEHGIRLRSSFSSDCTLPNSPTYSSRSCSPSNKQALVLATRDRNEFITSLSQTCIRKGSPPSSPHHPRLPSFHLLAPMDLDYGPGSNNSPESKPCYCGRLSRPAHQCHCPEVSFKEVRNNVAVPTISDTSQSSPKAVHAVLDLNVDSKPGSLYHNTGSTPHLPYTERPLPPPPQQPRSASLTHSVESSDAEHFPLSLFPTPPPLIVRKRIPAPLVLRPSLSTSSISSRDSTPLGTPTTPRFGSLNSPSKASFASPTKKFGRPLAAVSPPPCSPPNSPLPSIPISPAVGTTQNGHTLSTVKSCMEIRLEQPFPATHKLSSSEPMSDPPHLPVERSLKKNFETVRVKRFKPQMNGISRPPTATYTDPDAQVQWGYAY